MRKIAILKFIPPRYHIEDGDRHLVRGTGEWSETEIEYIGYFHQWAILDNKLYAVIETDDGLVSYVDSKRVKFIDTPKC